MLRVNAVSYINLDNVAYVEVRNYDPDVIYRIVMNAGSTFAIEVNEPECSPEFLALFKKAETKGNSVKKKAN